MKEVIKNQRVKSKRNKKREMKKAYNKMKKKIDTRGKIHWRKLKKKVWRYSKI